MNIVKDWYNNRNQTKSIQKLIKYEINYNLKLIEDFVKEINKNSEENKNEKHYNLRDIHLPPLNTGMYTNLFYQCQMYLNLRNYMSLSLFG